MNSQDSKQSFRRSVLHLSSVFVLILFLLSVVFACSAAASTSSNSSAVGRPGHTLPSIRPSPLSGHGTDYSDAPPPYLPAWHLSQDVEWLGPQVSQESAPLPVDTFDDGVTWTPTLLLPGGTIDVTFQPTVWTIYACNFYENVEIWIDWNRNGTWDSGEKVIDWYGIVYNTDPANPYCPPMPPTFVTQTVNVPSDAASGTTWLRARLFWIDNGSSGAQGDLSPTDPTAWGEVEDYPMVISGADTTPPSVAITNPTNNQSVSGTVNIRANASDNVAVSRVEFYDDNVLLGSDTTSPYSYTWDTTAEPGGHHTIKAIAYDTSSNQAEDSITVHVLGVGYGWTHFHADTAHSGHNPAEVFTTPLVFSHSWTYPPERTIHGTYASPSVVTTNVGGQAKGVAYLKLYDGVFAFDASNGQLMWSYPFSSPYWWWGLAPAVANGTVYAGAYNGTVCALDAATGGLVWQKPVGSAIYGAPTVSGEVVYVGASNGNLYALDASNGNTLWTFPTPGLVYSSPAVANVGGEEVVYIGAADSKVYAINASTGIERWNYPTGNVIHGSPAVSGGTVYIGSYDNKLYALDASTGALRWSYTTGAPIFSTPAVVDGVVYFGSKDHNLYALNVSDGSLKWSYTTTDEIYSSPAVVTQTDGNKTVFFGAGANMYGVGWDEASSSVVVKWQYSDGNTVRCSPAIYNKTVYITSFDYFYAFEDAGTINGYVFNDTNGNGTKDLGEAGIGAVNVYIRDSSNTSTIATASTNIDGFYTVNVSAGPTGTMNYKVVEGTPPLGEDPAGYASTTPNVVDVTVVNGATSEANFGDILQDTTPPSVSITNPSDGHGVSGAVDIRADASDNVAVNRVEFYDDNVLLGSDNTSPYSYNWDTTSEPGGFHTIKAIAYDTAGNQAESSITIYVFAPAVGTVTTNGVTTTITGPQTVALGKPFSLDILFETLGTPDDTLLWANQYPTLTAPTTLNLTGVNYLSIGTSPQNQQDNYTISDVAEFDESGATNLYSNWGGMGGYCPTMLLGDRITWNYASFVASQAGDYTFNIAVSGLFWSAEGGPVIIDPANPLVVTHAVTVIADVTPPECTITSPSNGSYVSGTTDVTVDATDNTGVEKVEFYVDGNLKSTDSQVPYAYAWNTTAETDGPHTILAKAYDAANNSGTSTAGVTVDNNPPAVSITSPADGSYVPASFTIQADASDTAGISKVEFYVNGELKATDITAPYSCTYTALAEGSLAVKAIAYDMVNHQTSDTHNVTVDNKPPTINSLTPANGSTVSTTRPTISAISSDGGSNYTKTYLTREWVNGGTALSIRGDDTGKWYTLPFTFPFYRANYTQVYVSSNGLLNFKVADNAYANSTASFITKTAIAPLWDDLHTSRRTGDDVYVSQPSPDSVCLRWQATTYSGSYDTNFEVILYQDGRVKLNYGNQAGGLTQTIGISKGDSTNYLLAHEGKTNLNNEQTVLFAPSSSGSGIDPATIVMKVDSGVVAHSYDPLTGKVSYTPTSDLSNGPHAVNLTLKDKAGNPASANWSFTVSVFTYTKTYLPHEWISDSTPLGIRGDDTGKWYTLPFTFPFYGANYAQVYVSSNGLLNFKVADNAYANSTSSFITKTAIAPLWDDLHTSRRVGDDVYVSQPSPDSVCLRWQAVTYSGSYNTNFEVILYQDGRIKLNYGAQAGGLTQTIGISKGDSTNYLLAHEGKTNLNNEQTVLFSPAPTVIGTVGVGTNPRAIDVNTTTKRIYTANYGSNNVSVIDGITHAVIVTVPVGGQPRGIAVNPATNRIYVANNSTNNVSVIDGNTNSVVATIAVQQAPFGVAVNQATNRVYVCNNFAKTVSVIDGATNAVITAITVPQYPSGVGIDSNTNTIYVANASAMGSNNLTGINGATNSITTTLASIGSGYGDVAVNPVTKRIYVTNPYSNNMVVVDGNTNTIINTIALGTDPKGVAVNSTTNRIYVAINGTNSVSIVDGVSGTVSYTIPVGSGPRSVCCNPAFSRVYAANYDSNTVSVIQN